MTQKNPTKMEKKYKKAYENALLVTSFLIAIGYTSFYFVLHAQEPDLPLSCIWSVCGVQAPK